MAVAAAAVTHPVTAVLAVMVVRVVARQGPNPRRLMVGQVHRGVMGGPIALQAEPAIPAYQTPIAVVAAAVVPLEWVELALSPRLATEVLVVPSHGSRRLQRH